MSKTLFSILAILVSNFLFVTNVSSQDPIFIICGLRENVQLIALNAIPEEQRLLTEDIYVSIEDGIEFSQKYQLIISIFNASENRWSNSKKEQIANDKTAMVYHVDIPHEDVELCLWAMYLLYHYYKNIYDLSAPSTKNYFQDRNAIGIRENSGARYYIQSWLREQSSGNDSQKASVLVSIGKFADYFEIPEIINACAALIAENIDLYIHKNPSPDGSEIEVSCILVDDYHLSDELLMRVVWHLLRLNPKIYPMSDNILFQKKHFDMASFSPDSRKLLTVNYKKIYVWHVRTGKLLLELAGHTDFIRSAHFSLDGTQIISAARDHTVRIWDAKTGKELQKIERAIGWYTSLSPDGRSIVHVDGKTIKICDVKTNIQQYGGNIGDKVTSALFSPDGQKLISLSLNYAQHTNDIKIWDVKTGTLLQTLTIRQLMNHKDFGSASLSPDGTQTAIVDNTAIRLWDVKTNRELTKLSYKEKISSASFSPNGAQIITTVDDNTLRLFSWAPAHWRDVFKKYTFRAILYEYLDMKPEQSGSVPCTIS